MQEEKTSLKKALKEGKLKEFSKENPCNGDKKAFDATLSSMAGKKTSTQGISPQ